MKTILTSLWIALSLFLFSVSHASTGMEAEISHLLGYIENSQCTFIRNGSEHDAANARAHIEKKYAYLKSRIGSTEDFIKYSATKSSMSGKKYAIVCAGNKHLVGQWLARELEKYRGRTTASN